jgi:hypothetical protein
MASSTRWVGPALPPIVKRKGPLVAAQDLSVVPIPFDPEPDADAAHCWNGGRVGWATARNLFGTETAGNDAAAPPGRLPAAPAGSIVEPGCGREKRVRAALPRCERSGLPNRAQLLLESWAVQAALRRRRGGQRLEIASSDPAPFQRLQAPRVACHDPMASSVW